MPVKFTALNDNPGPSYSFDGAAFHLISAANGWPVNRGGRTGLFISGTTYVQFTYDSAATKIRCFTSPDLVTWTEQDAAHAPLYSQSASTVGSYPQNINLAVCQSTANANVYYVLYFSGGGTITTQVLTLQPFTVGTGWGAVQASTLNLQVIGGGAQNNAIDGVVVYRASDDSIFYITGIDFTVAGGSAKTGYYARCLPNGSGWVNAWVQLGVVPVAGPGGGVNSISACLDTQGSVCVFQKAQINTPGDLHYHLYFQRVHADNSQSAVTVFDNTNYTTSGYLSSAFCSSVGKLYAALQGNGNSKIYTALTSDAPIFSSVPLPTLQGGFPSWTDFSTGSVIALTLEADGMTVSQSVDPFAVATLVSVAPVALYSIFALSSAASVARINGQLMFYGVRRRKGMTNDPQVYTKPSYEKPYDVHTEVVLPIGWSSASGGYLTSVPIDDFEFEMRRIDGFGGLTGGYLGLDPGNFKILLLDMNKIQISNIPVLFSALFHVPDTPVNQSSQPSANSIPKNFWPTPPMTYRVNSAIRFFIYMTSSTALVAPVTFSITFSGIRRYPCK